MALTEEQKKEAQELRAACAQLGEALFSQWQPDIVIGTFLPDFVGIPGREIPQLSMIQWLALEKIRSPFISEQFPAIFEDRVKILVDAVNALFPDAAATVVEFIQEMDPSEAVELFSAIRVRVKEARSTLLDMLPPAGMESAGAIEQGFGWWLPVLASAVEVLGMDVAKALHTPIIQLYALLCAAKFNRGFTVAGQKYAEMSAPESVRFVKGVPGMEAEHDEERNGIQEEQEKQGSQVTDDGKGDQPGTGLSCDRVAEAGEKKE